MLIMAGDIGGTRTRLRVVRIEPGVERVVAEAEYLSQAYTGLVPIVQRFLDEHGLDGQPVQTACLAVAGPVRDQRARVTNLPWQLDALELAGQLDIPRLRLINDFEGVAAGLGALGPSDTVVLQAGEPLAHGPRVVLGAGTGLGVALLVWQGDHYQVLAGEGGHVDFAPRDALELELWRYLAERLGRVSVEAVLSGPGLVRVYEFLRDSGRGQEAPAVRQAMGQGEPAAVIGEHAMAGTDALCGLALDRFVRIYGACAGNLALTCLATGGVFIAGGIAPRILSKLKAPMFMEAFRDKSPMQAVMTSLPVKVVVNTEAGLLGALGLARQLAGQ